MYHGIHFKNRGYILLPVMVMILVIVTVGIINSQQSSIDLRQTNDAIYQQQAQYVAEAGLQHALHQLETVGCGVHSDIPTQDFGQDKYAVTQTTNTIGGTITVYQIPVEQDSYIVSNNSGTNYGSATELETFFSVLPFSIVRSLFQFDFSASGIPAGSQILSAVAKIRVVDPNVSAAVTVHRITSAWDEGTVNWDNIESEHDTSAITSIPVIHPPANIPMSTSPAWRKAGSMAVSTIMAFCSKPPLLGTVPGTRVKNTVMRTSALIWRLECYLDLSPMKSTSRPQRPWRTDYNALSHVNPFPSINLLIGWLRYKP